MGAYKEPHGGHLVDLQASSQDVEALKAEAGTLPSWDLGPRQLCDLELLMNGAFSPLQGFLTRADYEPVLESMRLASGVLWPIPITLDVDEATAQAAPVGARLALRDPEGVLVAVLEVEDAWEADFGHEARHVYGTDDPAHDGVKLLGRRNPWYLGGRVRGVEAPTHYDFKLLRNSPRELRDRFEKLGWRRVVAFQTRNPMHRAHHELTHRAATSQEANLLLHPVSGPTKDGDLDHFTRVRCYEHILAHYPDQTTQLSLLGLAMRIAGPREALWHAIIRKNHGCTHFIVGRDHAGPSTKPDGGAWYGPYEAQELYREHEAELDISMVPFEEMVYVEDLGQYLPRSDAKPEHTILSLSGSEFRRRLQMGVEIPSWFSWPEIVRELRVLNPPLHQRGFTVFFTGLSGSGKSTIANALRVKLMEFGTRHVTLLDGDIVRKNLSSELGFSKEHRDINIRRIGWVASEITKNRGIAICAPIAPYAETRADVRAMIEPLGGFLEVHVSTPLAVCEARDRKGLYAKARAGLIQEFTGISDPYEAPEAPDMRIDTTELSPDLAAQKILVKLEALGYLA
ncbi:MAG: bifunctional sulfate adenylyltransferase/adenylylsulfate kinase [Planctomycetota bacterium]|nr:bifunctional sulfate adenylyltransferase/adenylylsulfate kinase [Planctomycetota bacterium]